MDKYNPDTWYLFNDLVWDAYTNLKVATEKLILAVNTAELGFVRSKILDDALHCRPMGFRSFNTEINYWYVQVVQEVVDLDNEMATNLKNTVENETRSQLLESIEHYKNRFK